MPFDSNADFALHLCKFPCIQTTLMISVSMTCGIILRVGWSSPGLTSIPCAICWDTRIWIWCYGTPICRLID